MVRMLEAATPEDVYDAYDHMAVDDDSILTCIGTSGPNPLPQSGQIPQVSFKLQQEFTTWNRRGLRCFRLACGQVWVQRLVL